MTFHIQPLNGFVVVVSIVVGCIAFYRSQNAHTGMATKGDLGVAVTCAAASVVILSFLFGLGDGSPAESPAPSPAATVGHAPGE
ncbi:hypothetical protein [Streptomyces liliifuscus]|uniref:Uncharacterized protein n=1 Tax=Streptomyces liliifuscus TaxID=2797636 RepID=A0A7T7HZA4_9ACTN|nr:hypothetical protein [Streptomyces liliifuscus]QQM38048.1 hypothetical protein JEQ17_00010 [Streptomyces liliifuscus]QQM46394.1 hypothetical protein JEQ17_48045 [Streptomyces liliifuscus]